MDRNKHIIGNGVCSVIGANMSPKRVYAKSLFLAFVKNEIISGGPNCPT
jgi:hypothetical protein